MPENSPAASLHARINSRQPHTARIGNYWLGGRDHYEVDRAAGDRIRELHPGIGEYARADRLFLGRAVRRLITDCGIRQFLVAPGGRPRRGRRAGGGRHVLRGGPQTMTGSRAG